MPEKTQILKFDASRAENHRYAAINEHLYSELKGEGVILNLNNGKYYGVNQVGDRIWKVIQSPASLQEIQVSLTNEYDIDPEICRREIISFLEQMVNEELIKVLNINDS